MHRHIGIELRSVHAKHILVMMISTHGRSEIDRIVMEKRGAHEVGWGIEIEERD